MQHRRLRTHSIASTAGAGGTGNRRELAFLRIVLVSPKTAPNVGAVARLLSNFGVSGVA